jgi:hypothetical protein
MTVADPSWGDWKAVKRLAGCRLQTITRFVSSSTMGNSSTMTSTPSILKPETVSSQNLSSRTKWSTISLATIEDPRQMA